MIKNIIFDMGNVLIGFDPEISLQLYFDNEEDRAIIRRELFQGPEWELGDYGTITNEERFEPVSKRVPARLHPQLRKCIYEWNTTLKAVPGAAAFCEFVKKEGYRIYVLSNADNNFHSYFPRFFKEESYFDGVMVSADEHMIKPDVRLYQHFLNRFGLHAGECLFIDDRPENIAGAQKAGLQGFVFRGDFDAVRSVLQLAI